MNEHKLAGENHETGAESSSQPCENAETGRARHRRSESPKSREERLSEINQYVTLVSSIFTTISPSALAASIAFTSDLNYYIVGMLFGIALVLFVAGLFWSLVSVCNLRKHNRRISKLPETHKENNSQEMAIRDYEGHDLGPKVNEKTSLMQKIRSFIKKAF